MTLSGLLAPFLESFPRWRARPWLLALLLALAPAAYVTGRYWQSRNTEAASMNPLESYPEILRRARATAKALGVDAGDWESTMRFQPDSTMYQFAYRREAPLPEPVRRVLPQTRVRVLLRKDDERWVQLTYTGEGQLLRFQASDRAFPPGTPMGGAEESAAIARAAMETILDPSAFQFGEASAKSSEGGRAWRFDWSVRTPCCRELAVSVTAQVQNQRILYLAVRTEFAGGYRWRLSTPLNLVADLLRLVFLYGGGFFIALRFARRAMEREVPWTRTFAVFALFLLVGGVEFALQPYGGVTDEAPGFLFSSWRYFAVAWALIFPLVSGWLLALCHGATEGDLRERYPGSVISLDALLSGRLLSANTATSVVAGAAWGAWAYAFTQLARLWLTPGEVPFPAEELRYSYSTAPWLGLLVVILGAGMKWALTVLSAPVTIGTWLVARSGWRRVGLMALASFGAVCIAGSPFADRSLAIVEISALVTLWAGLLGFDFLAAVTAMVVTLFGSALVDLMAMMPAWSYYALWARAVAFGTLFAALVSSWRGRRYSDAEVRPAYAHNIESRRSRESEVSAAREAQLRLLPEAPPAVPGLGLAAFCAPSSRGVSGDFFDFYPLARGRVGILVADGRAGGLTAALTIALAKGFVQYAAQRDWTPGDTLRRLREVLHRDGSAEDLNLAYVVIDPEHRHVRFARLGATPFLLAGLDGPDKTEPLSGPVADGAMEGSATFGLGDVLLFYTDGVPHRFAESHRNGIDQWLRNKLRLTSGVTATRLNGALQDALRTREESAADDLTAVVVRFEPVEARAVEVSA
ncbi:MAG: SpoIIE family protein phosphatase [Bryobacterales bacterium]|nr:SpoIIE family protein phosphatase [Bryobacterales bacterium]